MARSTRKLRLPITKGAAGKAPTWEPTARQWGTIRRACRLDATTRKKFDAAFRAKINKIVNRYFEHEQFDRRATLASEAINWLKGMESAMAAPLSAQSAAGGGGARRYAEEILDARLQAIGCQNLNDIIAAATTVAYEARAAIAEVNGADRRESDEKRAWRVMIASLWGLAFDHGLPTTLDANVDAKKSAFVRFIIEVQGTFGDVRVWHMDNADTLLTEIKKATIEARMTRLMKDGKLTPAI